ncbi:unnamed protein product [Victoria cruziana]
MVISLLVSKRVCYAVKRAAAHVFGKMGSSYAIACRAYETGKKIIMDNQNPEIAADMLVALTKLASKSSVLISEQIDMLLLFLNMDLPSDSHSTTLKCFGLFSPKAISYIPVNEGLLRSFLGLLDKDDIPVNLQCEAMRILRKVFCFSLPSPDQSVVVDLIKAVELAARSHTLAVKLVAFHLLVDLACSIKRSSQDNWCDKSDKCLIMFNYFPSHSQCTNPFSGENNLQSLPCYLTLVIMDEIALLCERWVAEIRLDAGVCALASTEELRGELMQKFPHLLGLARILMKEYPMVSHLALHRVKGLVETLVSAEGYDNQENFQSSSCEVPIIEGRKIDSSTARLLFSLCRFSCTCLDFLDAAEAIDAYIGDTVNMLMEYALKVDFSSHNAGICAILSLFLHFHVTLNCFKKPNQRPFMSRCEGLKQNVQNGSSCSVGMLCGYDQVDGQSQVRTSTTTSLGTRLKLGVLPGRKERSQGFYQPETCQPPVSDGGKSDGGLREINIEDECLENCHASFWVIHECLTLDFVKKTIRNKEFWLVYKIGKYAATQGAWFAASFIFSQFVCLGGVQSESCYCWLSSVSYLAGAENELHCLFFDEKTIQFLEWVKINDERKFSRVFAMETTDFCSKVPNLREYGIKVAEVHRKICLAEEMLSTGATLEPSFYFQRWFLKIRAKTLECLSDISGLLELFTYDKQSIGNKDAEKYVGMSFCSTRALDALTYHCTHMSFQLRILAKEFDLLAMSFMGIDMESLRYISILALNCSLLAFTAAFVAFFPEMPLNEFDALSSCSSKKQFHAKLAKDLAERLWYADEKISKELFSFSGAFGNAFLPSGTRFYSYDYIEGGSLEICRFAISRVLRLQKDAVGAHNDIEKIDLVKTGLVHLSEVFRRWIHLPSRIPVFFFRTRPCIGAEIFSSSGSKDFSVQSTALGSWLRLNLCVQMKNVPLKPQIGIVKMYCVVASRPSDRLFDSEDEKQVNVGFQAWKTEEMVYIIEELLQYMRSRASGKTAETVEELEKSGFVKSFASLRPNQSMQGFATCMLDVSAFPEGTYRCIWHCCCVDGIGRCWNLLPLNSGPIFSIKKRQ